MPSRHEAVTRLRSNELNPKSAMVKDFVSDPVLFFNVIWENFIKETGFELAPWQKEVLQKIAIHNFVAVTGCNDSGKTAEASLAVWWFITTRAKSVLGVTSVDQIQLNTVLWTELRRWYERSPVLMATFEMTATRIRHRGRPGDWWCVARTAKKQADQGDGLSHTAGLQGLHDEHLFLVIDEGSGVEDPNWDSAQSSIRHPDNRIFAISNPLRLTGRMFEIFTKPAYKKYWFTRHVSYLECPWIDKKMAEMQIEALGGPDSPVAQARWFGRFPELGATNILPSYNDVQLAMQRGRELDSRAIGVLLEGFDLNLISESKYSREELVTLQNALSTLTPPDYLPEDIYSTVMLDTDYPSHKLVALWKKIKADYFAGPCRLGVDLARFGDNETAFAVRRGWRIVELKGHLGIRQPDIIGRIKDYARRYPGMDAILVDATGIAGGMAIVDPLQDDGYTCVAVNFGGKAADEEVYANSISEMWLKQVAGNIKAMALPTDDILLNQLATRPYEFTGKNDKQLRILPKPRMKSISPDRAEAVCLAFAEVELFDGDDTTYQEIIEPPVAGMFSL